MKTRRMLQLIAMVVALGALILWLALGANRGWTKSERQVKALDEVTGIEGISYEKKFSPGVDFLFGAWAAGSLLACSALLFGRKPRISPEPSNP